MNLFGKILAFIYGGVLKILYTAKSGRYEIGPTAEAEMKRRRITKDDIEYVFRYGKEEETEEGQWKKRKEWEGYVYGIRYVKREDGTYFITWCWRWQKQYRGNPYWMKPKVYKG